MLFLAIDSFEFRVSLIVLKMFAFTTIRAA